MSEMIDRVAQAIRESNEDTMGLRYTELTEAMARAAIAAMRKPTEKMMYRGALTDLSPTEAGEVFEQMIDEALK